MRSRLKVLASGIIAALLVMTSVAMAQVPPASPSAGAAFEQRLDQRKKERNIKLDALAQKRLASQCTAAQSTVRSSQQKLAQLFTDRSKTYRQIDGKLWVTIGQLKLAEKDTFSLEQKRAAYAKKVGAVEASAADFQQTLDDIVVVNCKADVTGFKALVDTARLYLSQVRAQSADLRKYVLDDIKPTLNTHITDLQPKSTGNGGQ